MERGDGFSTDVPIELEIGCRTWSGIGGTHDCDKIDNVVKLDFGYLVIREERA